MSNTDNNYRLSGMEGNRLINAAATLCSKNMALTLRKQLLVANIAVAKCCYCLLRLACDETFGGENRVESLTVEQLGRDEACPPRW